MSSSSPSNSKVPGSAGHRGAFDSLICAGVFRAIVIVRSMGDRNAARTTIAKKVTPKDFKMARRSVGRRVTRSSVTTGIGGTPISSVSVAIYFVSPA
jgi:hypothetical protein